VRWLLLVLFVWVAPAGAANLAITVDGAVTDWGAEVPAFTDAAGDGGSSGIDFRRMWCANDQDYWYLRFETTAEKQGDEGQSMRLYLDTDLNASTGVAFGGVGAELTWDFGSRSGNFLGSSVNHADLGMLLAPTVSATEFEIALRRDATPNGSALFSSNSIRFLLRDLASGGDVAPASGGVIHSFAAGTQVVVPLDFARSDPADVRVCSYNVENDGLFSGGSAAAAQDRILTLIDADIWVFNEVWNHDAGDIETRLEAVLPSGPGQAWHTVKRDSGNVAASRWPILGSWIVSPGDRLTAVHLDLDSDHDRDLLVLAAHLSCCTADAARQDQVDALIGFLRDARTPGGILDLPTDTPIVAAGDFNLVGWSSQLTTLLTGDIADEGTYGPDSPPDWDGSNFDLPPTRHTHGPFVYTWRRDNSSFLPGLLDYTFYTGSVVDLGNHFILDTRTMPAAALAAHALFAGDTEAASDHSPRVLDLRFETGTAALLPAPRRAGELLPNSPNPFNPGTTLRFRLERDAEVRLTLVDVRGRRVRVLAQGSRAAGETSLRWDGRDEAGRPVASGVYRVVLEIDGDASDERAITLVQ